MNKNLTIKTRDDCPFPSHTPNAETRRAIEEALSGSRKGVKTFKSFEEFKKYMRSG